MNTIFVKQTSGEITTDRYNVIPLTLLTPIRLLTTKKTDLSFQKMNPLTGKFLYLNNNNDITEEEFYTVDTTETSIPNEVAKQIGSIDKLPHELKCMTYHKNKKYIKEANIQLFEDITEDNAYNFDLDEILDAEMANLLEASMFEYASYDFLNKIDWSESNIISANKLSVSFANESIVKIMLDNINITSNIALYNIPDDIEIRVNYLDEPFSIQEDGGKFIESGPCKNLILEFVNKTGSDCTIINPYVLFV